MKSLLIADDHLMFGNAMAYMLSQIDSDVRVVAVGSVDQALDQLATAGPFDLVLLDYDMPRTNGLQGLEMIQQQFPNQTVGMLSGRTDAHLVKSAIDGGAIGWLPKVMSEEPLLHALRMMAVGGQFIPKEVLAELKQLEDRWGSLTQTETQVANLVAEGLTDKEIAAQMELSPKTVENHVRSLLKKAGAVNRTKFAVMYVAERT
ncbi:response regulator transcription factor [uncultured Roseobacter sp.]|uniref:response regulator transcription factor n=1 Tax=uncultured Roseobacter sp. TaxID=114847 RepID=UPI00261B3374|nr:response regulator transcription factor [uncultured Roseobacter sp.]